MEQQTGTGAAEQVGGQPPDLSAFQRLLDPAGVVINGPRPWDPQLLDARALPEMLRHGTLGAGQAFMRRWWDVEQLDEFFFRVLRARLNKNKSLRGLEAFKLVAGAWLKNPQGRSRAYEVADTHYNLDNDLFAAMLDKRLTYSCGYWNGADSLDAAQENKLDMICRKLRLQPGQRVLDIGCGWGSFAGFAAERYGVEVVGITVSEEQLALAKKLCRDLPVELRLEDYRETTGAFDHIVSVGMIEHVGVRNYRSFFETANRCLKPDGLLLVHTIGGNFTATTTDPWINRYIFPNGQLPSLRQLGEASEGLFIFEDVHNFGIHYDKTLMAWFENFDAAWPELKAGYNENFYRMWKYYLMQSAGAFRSRDVQLWQIVFSERGAISGYERPEI